MTLRKLLLCVIVILLPLAAEGQKKKKRVVKKPPVVVVEEEPQEDPRITDMREMTQQIVIIDSLVTDRDEFLKAMRFSSETGRLMTTGEFFRNNTKGMAFLNEMGNKVYFSQPDGNDVQQLYTSDRLGTAWSEPAPLRGIGQGISEACYPFMMNDGITFYFAAKGEESIGGYDIFLTRYDSHSSAFFKPENIGMPFNSEANDYMYAIDELNNIGYFVSDRRQPEGKVCVYTFIPSETRRTYDANVFTEQQIRDFADIARIADTWGDGSERREALGRLQNLTTKEGGKVKTAAGFPIVINDQLTYSAETDFHSTEAAKYYKQLTQSQKRLTELSQELSKQRDYFAKASLAERQTLRQEILKAEEEKLQLNKRIHELEKQVRYKENEALVSHN